MSKFEDEEQPSMPGSGTEISMTEFDCPVCNANNPYGDGFAVGEEIYCFYCSTRFLVKEDRNGKIKFVDL